MISGCLRTQEDNTAYSGFQDFLHSHEGWEHNFVTVKAVFWSMFLCEEMNSMTTELWNTWGSANSNSETCLEDQFMVVE